jgi:two-component system chemotaxis response regulator CheB
VSARKVSVLVVDDSARNRQLIRQALLEGEGIDVVGHARDGDEGLKMAALLRPDVITLDLEMPKLDGFTFLRLLRVAAPTPVIVVSSYAHTSDVFKALELGAYEFVGKPGDGSLANFGEELREKVRAVRLVKAPSSKPPKESRHGSPFIVAIGASTGGPGAVQRLLEIAAGEPSACFLIAQHMPPGFTRAFAERLDRLGPWSVSEARSGDVPAPGKAFIAPGGHHLMLRKKRTQFSLEVSRGDPDDRHAPSVDRLFESAAEALADRAVGVVLTGMGADGALGARAIADAGGEVLAESEETAVIFGMPKEAIAAGAVKRVLALGELGGALLTLARRRAGGA